MHDGVNFVADCGIYIIPDKKILEQQRQRGVFRLNNFLNDPYFINQLGLSEGAIATGHPNAQAPGLTDADEDMGDLEDDELEVELTEE